MILSQELYDSCFVALSQCSEFGNDTSLQAIFVTPELRPYRDRLPASSTIRERVSKTIDYLLEKRLSGGRPVFPVFLANIRDKYDPDDDLFEKLHDCYLRARKEVGRTETIDIPFVVVAMNREEAKALDEGRVFDNPVVPPIERQRFQQFRESLEEDGIADWVSHYSDRRENWTPRVYPYGEQKTVEETIRDIVFRINSERRRRPNLPLINAVPRSEDFFSDGGETRTKTWERIRVSGGVLILDAISLFHPDLHQILLQSAISSSGRVAILVLSPVSFDRIRVNRLIEKRIDSQIQLAFSRFDRHLDVLCELGAGDLRFFRRWLFGILPQVEAFVREESPNSESIEAFRQMTKEPPQVEQLIFRRHGRR
jgi:hypothetical protein